MMKEESFSDLDTFKINARAIAQIASLAVGEIEGVRCATQDLKAVFSHIFGCKEHEGIKVKFDKNNEAKIRISLIVKYGYNIPQIAAKVKDNVYHALEKMAGISIKEIDINVSGVER
ncbi:MAG: Asp23/Gls24 family envelope stress response protein [Candidatus Omnitrophica bacterium]|nr:Asp23/Gls24 family envelope stress response protein [Candidatus Omnitrophota bacterium]MCM8770967.1 Asp23/Gls24 family envelope stress response protein [Candidatus Omnitrophota bacterium]